MRVKDGNKTGLITHLTNDGEGSSEEPDEGKPHDRFCEGASIVTSELLLHQEVRYELYSTSEYVDQKRQHEYRGEGRDCCGKEYERGVIGGEYEKEYLKGEGVSDCR